ncbi:response regulator [Oceanicola sp. S124]|uniref:response regulator n=1 Tax=Oceanicola sp. S124 TaxID=1042378 RepID=UPI0002559021|nr:response regulator transcription factor [Oceanicola sp. S124]
MRRALVLEDVPETRSWLCAIAREAFPGIEVTEAGSLRAGREALRREAPDLALIDLSLPDGTGLDLLAELRQSHPEATCVIATVSADDANVVAALAAGAQGYLLKDHPAELLASQLRQISHGIPALSPVIARRIMTHFRNTGPVDSAARLTPRESDVLALIARGLRNAEVAQNLEIAETTVAGYIKTIYRKLGISSRAEAAWHATRMGLAPQREDR